MADFTFNLKDISSTDAAKKPSSSVSEGRRIAEQAAEGPLQEVVSSLPWAQAATGFAPLFGYPSGYDITSQQALDASRAQLGLSGEQPSSLLGKGAGAAVKAITSPSTYYTAPLFGMAGNFPVKNPVSLIQDLRPLRSAVTDAASAAGAEMGGELYGTPGAVIGGIGGGATSLFSPSGMAVHGLNLWNKFRGAPTAGEALNDFTTSIGNKRVANVVGKAFESDPTLQANLLRASEIENLTGVKLPTTAASQGSNVLLQKTRSEAAKSPEFLAQIRIQEQEAKDQILKRAVDLFGEASTGRVLKATEKTPTAIPSLEKRLSNIDDELAAIGNRVDNVDPTTLGTRTANLVKAKEEIARKEVAPMYENSLTDAEKAGINLNPGQTQRLYDFVNSSVNQDVFKTFPTIYSKVNKVFAPDVVKTGVLDDAGKEITEDVFKTATVRDLDSLKREINKQLYTGNASQDTKRILGNLRNELNSVVDELPASFRDSYRGADAAFLTKVGVPFDAKAIEDIGSKKFIEQTVPVLTKNSSAMNQFLDVAGEEGKGIVRDAFMYELSKTPNLINESGAVNPKLVDRFIQKNKDTLKNVPEVADELRNLANDSRSLLNSQTRLSQLITDETKREADNLFNRVNKQGLDATLNKFLVSPLDRSDILGQLKTNPEAEKGFRAAMLQQLTASGNTLNFFETNKDAMTQLFGKTYIKNVEALAEATQLLYQNPVKLSVPLTTVGRTKFEEAVGMPPEQVLSLYRRQITSPIQKVTIGLSKFFQNKTSQAESQAFQALFSDTHKIQELSKLYGKMTEVSDPKELAALAKQIVRTTSAEAGSRVSSGAFMGILNAAEAEDSKQPVVSPEMDMQFNFSPPNPVTQ